eukprot:4000968-Amphidinium_carterae.1
MSTTDEETSQNAVVGSRAPLWVDCSSVDLLARLVVGTPWFEVFSCFLMMSSMQDFNPHGCSRHS